MNPQQQGQPQNPFMSLLSQLQKQGGSQTPGAGMNPMVGALGGAGAGPVSPPGGSPIGGGVAKPPEDAALPGQNPGITKNLLGAMSQLHAAIGPITDPKQIQLLRQIILMLNRLIEMDQEDQNGKTGQSVPAGLPSGLQPGSPNPAM